MNLTFEHEPSRYRDSNIKFAPLICGILPLFALFFMMQVKNRCRLCVFATVDVYASETVLWFHGLAIAIWIASLAKDCKA
jgi:hypothetical protein